LRELQLEASRRTAEPRNLLLSQGSADHHRKRATPLKRRPTAFVVGLQAASLGGSVPNAPGCVTPTSSAGRPATGPNLAVKLTLLLERLEGPAKCKCESDARRSLHERIAAVCLTTKMGDDISKGDLRAYGQPCDVRPLPPEIPCLISRQRNLARMLSPRWSLPRAMKRPTFGLRRFHPEPRCPTFRMLRPNSSCGAQDCRPSYSASRPGLSLQWSEVSVGLRPLFPTSPHEALASVLRPEGRLMSAGRRCFHLSSQLPDGNPLRLI
jgi:hypothetical protein